MPVRERPLLLLAVLSRFLWEEYNITEEIFVMSSRTRLHFPPRSLQILSRLSTPLNNSLLSLNPDILGHIAKYLDAVSLLSLRLTCRRLSVVRPARNTTLTTGNLLPVEIIQQVLSNLLDDPVALDAARQTCRSWRGASYGKHLLQVAVEKFGVNTDVDALLPRPSSASKQSSTLTTTLRFCSKVIEYASPSPPLSPTITEQPHPRQENEDDACIANQCDSSRCEAARLQRLGSILATNASKKYDNWRSLKIPRCAFEIGRKGTAVSSDGLFIFGLEDDARSGRVYAMYEPKSYFNQLRLETKAGSGSKLWHTYQRLVFPSAQRCQKGVGTPQARGLEQNTEPTFLFSLPKLDSLGRIKKVEFIAMPEKFFSTHIYMAALIERLGNFAAVVLSFKYTRSSGSWNHENTVFHDFPRSEYPYSLFSVSPVQGDENRLSVFIAVGSSKSIHTLRVPISNENLGDIDACNHQGLAFSQSYIGLKWVPFTEGVQNPAILLSASVINGPNELFAPKVLGKNEIHFTRVFCDDDTPTEPVLKDIWAIHDSAAAVEGGQGIANSILIREGQYSTKISEPATPNNSNATGKVTKLAVVAAADGIETSYFISSVVTYPAYLDQTYSRTRLCLLKTPSPSERGSKAVAFDGVAISNLGTYIAAIFPNGSVRVWVIPYTFEEGRKATQQPLVEGGELPYPPEFGKSLGTFTGASSLRWDWRGYETLFDKSSGKTCANPMKGMVLRLIIGCETGTVFACDFSEVGPGGAPVSINLEFTPQWLADRSKHQGQVRRWIGERSSIKCLKA